MKIVVNGILRDATPEEILDIESTRTNSGELVLIPQSISDRQFFQQLAIQGLITEQEAEEAVGPGTIPVSMVSLINQLPVEQRFSARMLVRGATRFERNHSVTKLIGTLYGLSDSQIDTLWVNASKL